MAMATTRSLPSIASETSLARYLQEIRRFPMLDEDLDMDLGEAEELEESAPRSPAASRATP